MKIIYEILYPFGAKEVQVEDDFETKFPHTEVVPDPDRDLMLQFWDVKLSVWRPVEFMAGTERIALLEKFYEKATEDVNELTGQNEMLNEKVLNQDIQLTDTQLALAEVYEMLIPADKEVK